MKIVGYKYNNFNTKDGNHISGYTFYVTDNSNRDEITGLITDKIFISDSKMKGQKFEIGYEIVPVYNRFGKIESVTVIEN